MSEKLSNCCGAPFIGETDLCSECKEHADIQVEEKEVPHKLTSENMARVLRIQYSLCVREENIGGCDGIDCDSCILDADLPEFTEWLREVLEKESK